MTNLGKISPFKAGLLTNTKKECPQPKWLLDIINETPASLSPPYVQSTWVPLRCFLLSLATLKIPTGGYLKENLKIIDDWTYSCHSLFLVHSKKIIFVQVIQSINKCTFIHIMMLRYPFACAKSFRSLDFYINHWYYSQFLRYYFSLFSWSHYK